jgi:hypothetical protein
MKTSKKPRATRYKSTLPLEIKSGKGITLNFSGSGIFFETEECFSPGQQIDFSLLLEHIDPDHNVRITCKGEIVRIEEKGKKIGVAANIISYEFETLQRTMNN